MIVDPPPLPSSNSKLSNNDQLLRLNPGVTHRKPRSACKLCLWLLGIIIVTFGSYAVYLMITGILNAIRNPHRDMYHDEKGKGGVTDWSQVVKPMIEKNSKFDVVASVWIRDDTLAESGRDASLKIDDEERPEKLVFTEKVFKDVDANSKTKFANVKLRIPTSHFKQANLSNYDLRASFVLVQSDENSPSWLDFAKNFTSWKPQSLEMPSVRKHEADMTLQDKIYDSFGISIPLIEFHNITSKRPSNKNDTLQVETPAINENVTQSETESEVVPDEEQNWDEEETPKSQKTGKRSAMHSGRNTHGLEFSGGRLPVTEYHPYVVTRTHLRIMKQDRLFKRKPYTKTQKEVASKICVESPGKPIANPEWYECRRYYMSSGVFETKVQVQLPPSSENTGTKIGKKWRTEWLYAPYFSAMQRVAGPKDIVPIPVNREDVTQTETSEEEYVTVNWKLTFSSHTAAQFTVLDASVGEGHVYNMTQPEPSLQSAQREHDITFGIYGHRVDEDAHPRRTVILAVVSYTITPFLLFAFGHPLLVHPYHYNWDLTAWDRAHLFGIFTDNLEELLVFMFDPENQKSGIWMFPISHILDFIEPCVMFLTVTRLELRWSIEKESGSESGKTKKFWVPRVDIAKASHSERASERREARLSKRTKLMIFVTTLAVAHFCMTPKSYLISPTFELPEGPRKHALESFSSHIPTISKHLRTFVLSCFITGRTLQFIMNYSSRTYAGGYKLTIPLSLASHVVALSDMVPSIVGTTLRTEGFTVIGGVLIVMDVVSLVQAVKYGYAKDLDGEDEE